LGSAIVSFNQARIIINDVFVTNFFRVFYALIGLTIVSLIKTEFLESFKKENKKILKFYFYIAIAGILSLGLADKRFLLAVALIIIGNYIILFF